MTLPVRKALAAGTILTMDCAVLLAGLWFGDLVMYWLMRTPVSLRYSLLVVPVWALAALWLGLVPGWGLNPVVELRHVERLLAAIYALAAVIVFVGDFAPAASRGSYFIAYAAAAVGLPTARHIVRERLAHHAWWGAPVILVGDPPLLDTVANWLQSHPAIGYRPARVVRWTADESQLSAEMERGSEEFETIVLARSGMTGPALEQLLDGPLRNYRKVVLVPELLVDAALNVLPEDLQGIPGLTITNQLADPRSRGLKRTLDLLLVFVLAPLWLPLGTLAALAILLWDRRWPLFSQERIGQGGQSFRIWKLRTMVPDAERQLEERLANDPAFREEWARMHKLEHDWRVSPIGRVLRRWSLDEIPQVWNVLRGEMSLVGPRPLPNYHHAVLPPHARHVRERVRPGITGLWQIRGRSDLDIHEMARWDVYYVRNWSVWLDLLILAQTLWAIVSGRGAR